MLRYRELTRGEAQLLGTIDRSEQIDGVYRADGASLELEHTRADVRGWEPSELRNLVARLERLMAAGGIAVGAWHDSELVGLGALDVGGVGGDRHVMKLDLLHVGAAQRGHGVGRKLTEMIADAARARGAKALYISATPTRATVDAYLRMGAKPLTRPDPELHRLEPADIHLLLDLSERRTPEP